MNEQGSFEGLTPQKNKDDIESLRSELEQIRSDILADIEANEADINALEQALAEKADLNAIPASKRDRVVHWVQGPFKAVDTELTCEQIVSTDLAGEVFRDYLVNREDVMPVGVGDILALNCNISRRAEREEFDGERYHVKTYGAIEEDSDLEQPSLDEESSGSEDEGEEEEEILDKIEGCTYLGLVLGTDGLFQDRSPLMTENNNGVTNEVLHNDVSQRIQRVYEGVGDNRKALYEILVWSTCTNSGGVDDCPDEVEKIDIEEILDPEESSYHEPFAVVDYAGVTKENTQTEEGSNQVIKQMRELSFNAGKTVEKDKKELFLFGKVEPDDLQYDDATAIGIKLNELANHDFDAKEETIDFYTDKINVSLYTHNFDGKKLQTLDKELVKSKLKSDKCGSLEKNTFVSLGEIEENPKLSFLRDLSDEESHDGYYVKVQNLDLNNVVMGESEDLVSVGTVSVVSLGKVEDSIPTLAKGAYIPVIPEGNKHPLHASKEISHEDITNATLLYTPLSLGKRQLQLRIDRNKKKKEFSSGLFVDEVEESLSPIFSNVIDISLGKISISGISLAGFTGELIFQGVNESSEKPKLEVKWADSIEDVSNMRAIEVIQTDVVEKANVESGLIKEDGTGVQNESLVTKGSLNIPYSEFEGSLMNFQPVSIGTYEYTSPDTGSGSENSGPVQRLKIDYQVSIFGVKNGLLTGENNTFPDSIETDLPSITGTDFNEDISYDITDKVSIFTIEPESDADEGVTKIGIGLKTNRRTIKTEDGLITDDIVAETEPVKIYTSEIDLPVPTVSIAGTDFSGKIKQPLFINYGENINPIGIFQPVSNERAIEIGLSSENAQKNLVYEVQTQLVASKQLDVEDGLIDGLENTENSFEFMGEQSSYVLQIPKVSLGTTQGITKTIECSDIDQLSFSKTESLINSGGETITIQSSYTPNSYEVENGLIKEGPTGDAIFRNFSFEIPPAGGTVSLGTGVTEDLKVIRADATPSVTVGDKEGDATKTQVQIRLETNSLEVENGLVKSVTASEGSEDELLISFDIPKSEVSGYTEKAMLVCDEDGNSRVIRVLAKE